MVGFDHDPQRPLLTRSGLRHELLEGNNTLGRATTLGLAIEALPTLRNLARLHRVLDDDELVARHWDPADTEHLRGDRGPRFLDVAAALVEQCPDATGIHAADEVVTYMESAVLDEDRSDGAFARIELGFDHRAGGAPVGVRFEVQNLRLQQDLVEQRFDVRPLLG